MSNSPSIHHIAQGPPPPVGALIEASKEGKLNEVKRLIAAGFQLEEKDQVNPGIPSEVWITILVVHPPP